MAKRRRTKPLKWTKRLEKPVNSVFILVRQLWCCRFLLYFFSLLVLSLYVLSLYIFCTGRHLKRYRVVAITLRYDFALAHNPFLLSRTVIAFNGYRSVHIEPVIAFYSYQTDVIDKRYSIYSLSPLGKIAFKSKTIQILFSPNESINSKKK
jgi:hypothetical protein